MRQPKEQPAFEQDYPGEKTVISNRYPAFAEASDAYAKASATACGRSR
jgi:hypothetical protein